MLGAAAVGQMQRPGQRHGAATLEPLARTAGIAQDHEALRRQLAELLARVPHVRAKEALPTPEPADWFVRMLDAPLSDRELVELGAIPAVAHHPAAAHQ